MRSLTSLIIVLFLSVITFVGCNDSSTSPTQTAIGTLKISLTDAPAAFEAVNVTFSEVSAHTKDDVEVVPGSNQDLGTITLQ